MNEDFQLWANVRMADKDKRKCSHHYVTTVFKADSWVLGRPKGEAGAIVVSIVSIVYGRLKDDWLTACLVMEEWMVQATIEPTNHWKQKSLNLDKID